MDKMVLNTFSTDKKSSFSETHVSQIFSYKNTDSSKLPITKKITKNASSATYFDPEKKHSKKYSVHYYDNKKEIHGKDIKHNNETKHDIIVESNPNNTFNMIIDGNKTEELHQKEILEKLKHMSSQYKKKTSLPKRQQSHKVGSPDIVKRKSSYKKEGHQKKSKKNHIKKKKPSQKTK